MEWLATVRQYLDPLDLNPNFIPLSPQEPYAYTIFDPIAHNSAPNSFCHSSKPRYLPCDDCGLTSGLGTMNPIAALTIGQTPYQLRRGQNHLTLARNLSIVNPHARYDNGELKVTILRSRNCNTPLLQLLQEQVGVEAIENLLQIRAG
jgi:hypothetical protein